VLYKENTEVFIFVLAVGLTLARSIFAAQDKTTTTGTNNIFFSFFI
jgi:hypothetical protein